MEISDRLSTLDPANAVAKQIRNKSNFFLLFSTILIETLVRTPS